jgi:hypothetical protein
MLTWACSATEHRLVVRHLSHLGHAAPADSHWPELCGFRYHVLVQRYGRMAVSARRAPSGASDRCLTHRTRAPMWADTTTILSSTPAGSSSPLSCRSCAPTAADWPTRCGPMASRPSRFWRSICACVISSCPTSIRSATRLAHRCALHARVAAGLPERPQRGRPARRIYVRAGVSSCAGDGTGSNQPASLSPGRDRLVQLLDQ